MHFAEIVFFTLATSLDSLAVGATYSMRRIRVPKVSLIVLGLISCVVSFISLTCGRFLGDVIDGRISNVAGGVLLLSLGLWQLVSGRRQGAAEGRGQGRGYGYRCEDEAGESLSERIDSFDSSKSILSLLAHPEGADRDSSGVLSVSEAGLLGLALSLDAASAGFAMGVSGIWSLWVPVLVGCVSAVMVWVGFRSGSIIVRRGLGVGCRVLPGLILMAIGVSRFFRFSGPRQSLHPVVQLMGWPKAML